MATQKEEKSNPLNTDESESCKREEKRQKDRLRTVLVDGSLHAVVEEVGGLQFAYASPLFVFLIVLENGRDAIQPVRTEEIQTRRYDE
jgi:hypothetical protein